MTDVGLSGFQWGLSKKRHLSLWDGAAAAVADVAPHKAGRLVRDEQAVRLEDRRQLQMCAAIVHFVGLTICH